MCLSRGFFITLTQTNSPCYQPEVIALAQNTATKDSEESSSKLCETDHDDITGGPPWDTIITQIKQDLHLPIQVCYPRYLPFYSKTNHFINGVGMCMPLPVV